MKNIVNYIVCFLVYLFLLGCNSAQIVRNVTDIDHIIKLEGISQKQWDDLKAQVATNNKNDFIFVVPQYEETRWTIGFHTFIYDLDNDDIEDFREEFLILYDNVNKCIIDVGTPFYYNVNNNGDDLYSPTDEEVLIDPKRDGLNGNETVVKNEAGYLVEIDQDQNMIIYEGILDASNNPDFKRDDQGNPIIFYKENLERRYI